MGAASFSSSLQNVFSYGNISGIIEIPGLEWQELKEGPLRESIASSK